MSIILPAGIGDIFWVCQKLATTGEKYDFEVVHERGKQVLDMLPWMVKSIRYSNYSNGNVLYQNIAKNSVTWERIKSKPSPIFLSCNNWVDSGQRLESWLPDLDTDWELASKFVYNEPDVLDKMSTLQNVGIYTSSISNVSKFDPPLWFHKQWFDLIYKINQNKESHFILIGADYDRDLLHRLKDRLEIEGISYWMCIDPLPYVMQIFKKLDYFIGRASGIGILADAMDIPSIMLYPWHETRLLNSWCKPRRKQIYQGMIFKTPSEVFEHIPKDLTSRRLNNFIDLS